MDIWFNKGAGYTSKGQINMVRCFDCGLENYSMAVSSGCCAFCGYNPNTTSIQNKSGDMTWDEMKSNVEKEVEEGKK